MPKLEFSIQIVHEESDFYNGFARQCVFEQTKQQIGIFIFADSLYLAPMGAGMGGLALFRTVHTNLGPDGSPPLKIGLCGQLWSILRSMLVDFLSPKAAPVGDK